MMEDADATVFFDDEDECSDYECIHNSYYDYDFIEAEKETLYELYQNCLSPTLYDTAHYMLPLLANAILFRLLIHTRKIFSNIYIVFFLSSFFSLSNHFSITIQITFAILYCRIHIRLGISYIINNRRLVHYSASCI